MTRKTNARKTSVRPTNSRPLAVEALEPRLLLTATSNAELITEFQAALHQQLLNWEGRVTSYAAQNLDAAFGDALQLVDAHGNLVSSTAASLKDLLSNAVVTQANSVLTGLEAKVNTALGLSPDMANFGLRQVAEQIGSNSTTEPDIYRHSSTDSVTGLTLVTEAVVGTSADGKTDNLQLNIKFQSNDQFYVAQSLQDKLANLGVKFTQNLQLSGHAEFDVDGAIDLTRNYTTENVPASGSDPATTITYLSGYTAHEDLKDLGAKLDVKLSEAAGEFSIGFLKFKESVDPAQSTPDVEIRLEAQTRKDGHDVAVQAGMEVALDLEGKIEGHFDGFSHSQDFKLQRDWNSIQNLTLDSTFEQTFGAFRNVSAGDVVAQLQKIQSWLSSLLAVAPVDSGSALGASGATTLAQQLNGQALGSRLDQAANFSKAFENEIFKTSMPDDALVEKNAAGSVTKILFDNIGELGDRLVALNLMDSASDLAYDKDSKVITANLHIHGNFLDQDLPANFSLLDGTVASIKSNSDFDAKGTAEMSFTLKIDLGNATPLVLDTAKLADLNTAATEAGVLQQTVEQVVGTAFVDASTLRAASGPSNGALPYSGILSGDAALRVVVDGTAKTVTLPQDPTSTSLDTLATDLATALNGVFHDATTNAGFFTVTAGASGGLKVQSTHTFSLQPADIPKAYSELHLGSALGYASVSAVDKVDPTNAENVFNISVSIGGKTYSVTSDARQDSDRSGLDGMLARINRGLTTARQGLQKVNITELFGLKFVMGSSEILSLEVNSDNAAADQKDSLQKNPPTFTLSGASGLGFGTDAALVAQYTVNGGVLQANGRLAQDVTIGLKVESTTDPTTYFSVVIAAQDPTHTNQRNSQQNGSVADLVKQINDAFAAKATLLGLASAPVVARLTGDVIYLQATSATTTISFDTTTADKCQNLALLGFGDEATPSDLEQSSTAELKVFYQNGDTQFIDFSGLDSTSTLDQIKAAIESQSGHKLLVEVGSISNGGGTSDPGPNLVIRDLKAPTEGLKAGILSWNGSWMARLLGIEGLHTITKTDVDSYNAMVQAKIADPSKPDAYVERSGDGITKGTTGVDRFSITNFVAKGDIEMDVPSYDFTVATSQPTTDTTTFTLSTGDFRKITAKYGGQYVKIGSTRFKILKVDDTRIGDSASPCSVVVIKASAAELQAAATANSDGTYDVQIEGVQISATMGPVGVHLIGRGGEQGRLGRELSVSTETDRAYKLSELLEAFQGATTQLGAMHKTVGGVTTDVATTMIFDVVEDGIALTADRATSNLAGTVQMQFVTGQLLPVVTADFSPLQNAYANLRNLTVDDILDVLDQVVQNITDLTGNDGNVFDQKIPGINKSINDIVDIARDVKKAVDEVRANGQGDLAGILDLFRAQLGLSAETFKTGIEQKLVNGVNAQYLSFHLEFKKDFNEKETFGFENTKGIEVGGGAELYASGNVDLVFDFAIKLPAITVDTSTGVAIDVKDPIDILVKANSGLTADLTVSGQNLKFNLGLGGTGIPLLSDLIEVGSKDGTKRSAFNLHGAFKATTLADFNLTLDSNLVDELDHIVHNENPDDPAQALLDTSVTGNIGAELPVYVVGMYQGEIKLGEWVAANTANPVSVYTGANTTDGLVDFSSLKNMALRSATTDTIQDGAAVLDISDLITHLANLGNLSNYNLFDKVKLAVDGLDMALSGIEGEMQKRFSDPSLKMPILGDALKNGADFLSDFRDKFLDPFRNFVYEASNIDATTVANYLDNALRSTVLSSSPLLQSWNTTKQTSTKWGRDFNSATNTNAKTSSNGVAYLTKQTGSRVSGAEWAFELKGTYGVGTNFGLDLGIPGLGLKTTGGVDAELVWTLDLGFGIDETKGFYLILPSGEEISVDLQAEVDPASTLKGSLGFLGLVADNPDIEAVLGLKLDLNKNAGATDLGFSNLGSLHLAADVEAHVRADLDLTLGIDDAKNDNVNASFPDIKGRFEFQWAYAPGSKDGAAGITQAGFENVRIDLGQYVKNVLQPVAAQIKKVTDPIQPLVDFLTTPFPVLSDIGLRITPLDLAKLYAKSQGQEFNDGMIRSIAKLAQMANTINELAKSIATDGTVKIGDFFFVGAKDGTENGGTGTVGSGNSGATKASSLDVLRGKASASNVDPESLMGFSQSEIDAAKTLMSNAISGKLGSTFTSKSADPKTEAETSGLWTFPIVQDPSQIFGLLMGKDATLVHYTMAPLIFNFEYSQFFPIIGPIGARIGVNLGAEIKLAFGYDTYGIREFVKDDFKKPLDLIDGLYVDDNYGGSVDVPELKLHGGLTAAAEINLGIVSGGVGGGVGIDVLFDLHDPNHDGKVRLNEMWENVEDEAKYGNVLMAPLAIFDVHGRIYAELFAYLNTFWHDYKWQITDPITIAQFDIPFTRAAKMAEERDGTLIVHVGDQSAGRLNGNLTDGDDNVTVAIDGNKVKISSSSYNADNQEYTIGDGEKIIIDSGLGNDSIKVTSTGAANVNLEIDGGVGNDTIDLSGFTAATGTTTVVRGSEGADTIKGPADLQGTASAYLFGDGGDLTYSTDRSIVIGAQAVMNPDGDGKDVIVGGAGSEVIFGGGKSDSIDGGAGNDFIFGDEGRVQFADKAKTAFPAAKIDRTQLHDGGGDDVLVGGAGNDWIYGGTGNDKIDGGADADHLYGEKGNDAILGGTGDDVIDGGEGADVIFGDRFAVATFTLSSAFPSGVLPAGVAGSLVASSFTVPGSTASDTGTTNGSDTIVGGQGSDVIFGDDGVSDAAGGKDSISGGLDNDLISGDGGNDTLKGDAGNDVIYGGAGSDIIDGGAGDDILLGGSGYMTLRAATVPDGTTRDTKAATSDNPDVFGQNTAAIFGYRLDATASGKHFSNMKSIDTQDGADTISVGQGSDFVDGQGGDDIVNMVFVGGNARGTTNVMDTGSTTQDKLNVMGTMGADQILMRASVSGLGQVDLVPDASGTPAAGSIGAAKSNLERVNLWSGGIDNLSVDAGMGDDNIAIDGSVASTSVDAGSGDDVVTVGQLYKSARDAAANPGSNIAVEDSFGTIETTQGFLSDGATNPLSVHGGTGNDKFVNLGNSAPVTLYGDEGDDSFSTQAFLRMSDKSPIVHAPLNIDGGAGYDSFRLGGSEGPDTFFITKQGVLSSGGTANTTSIENQSIVAGAGDDTFNVIGTNATTVTHLEGGLGNDTVNNGGLASGLAVPGSTLKGYSSALTATVKSSTASTVALGAVAEAAVNVVDIDSEPQILFTNETGSAIVDPALQVTEGSSSDTNNKFAVRLSKALAAGEKLHVTISGPEISELDGRRGDSGLVLSSTGKTGASITLEFDSTNWSTAQLVTVTAPTDALVEGNLQAFLNTSVSRTKNDKPDTYSSQVRSIAVQLTDASGTPAKGAIYGSIGTGTPGWKDEIDLEGQNSVDLRYALTPLSGFAITLDGQALPAKGAASSGTSYIIDGRKLVFWSSDLQRVVGIKGRLKIAQYDFVTPVAESFPAPVAATVPATGVVVTPARTSLNVVEGGAIKDSFNVKLAGPLTAGQTVTVLVSTKAFTDGQSRAALGFTSASSKAVAQGGDLLLTFDSTNATTGIDITLSAATDSAIEKGDTIYVSAQPQTLAGIDGAVFAEGNGSTPALEIGEPVLLSYRTAKPGATPEAPLPETNEYTDKLSATASDAITLQVAGLDTSAWGTDKFAAQIFDADGNMQLRRIKLATGSTLTLEKAIQGAATSVASVRIVPAQDSVFVDERSSVDRIFIHDQEDTLGGSSSLVRLSTEGALTDLAALFATQMDAMRYRLADAAGTARIAPDGITYGDFELTEIDLGTGVDAVHAGGAASRTDGFRTVTIINTGDESGAGDAVTVDSYQAEVLQTIASGVLGAPVQDPTSAVPDTIAATGIATTLDLTGFVIEVSNSDGSVQRRTVMGAARNATTGVTTISLDRAFGGTVQGSAFQIRADIRAGGWGSIDSTAFVSDSTTGTYTVTLPAASTATAQVGDWFEAVGTGSDGKTFLVRQFVTGVSGKTLTLNGDLGSSFIAATAQYRLWRHTDGLLAINTQAGDDTITATGAGVTGSLIAFGGLGDDTIDLGSSAYAFGDRGQIRYAGDGGQTVTLLGTDDAGGDYTSPTASSRYQTDGVQRAAVSFKTFDDQHGGDDTITTGGTGNVVMGGFGTDTLTVGGNDNYVMGDGGQVAFAPSGSLAWGDRQSFAPVSVSTTSDDTGSTDTIQVTGSKNVVMGGAGNDGITISGGNNIVMGDGGSAIWASGSLAQVQTTGAGVGGNDTIDITGASNKVMGGAGLDVVDLHQTTTGEGGNNVVLGDEGQALWTAGVLTKVTTTNPSVGAHDEITVDGGFNAVLGGADADKIVLNASNSGSSGNNVALGDNGEADYAGGQLSRVFTTDSAIGGNDTITVTGANNVAMGGAADDGITLNQTTSGSAGNNVALGDGGEADWTAGQLTQVFTVDNAIGGVDTINVWGGRNTAMGGAAGDTINLNESSAGASGHNVALGDGGKATWTAGQITDVKTQDDGIGGADTINLYGAWNVAMGGATGDTITINAPSSGAAGNNVVLGDGGESVWTQAGLPVSVITTSDSIGGGDHIYVHGGNNTVAGGADQDVIEVWGDRNQVLGDGGQALWTNGVLTTVQTTSDDIGGVDQITIHGGTNVVMGGAAGDNILIDGAGNVVTGDGGIVTYRTNGNLQRVQTKADGIGGSDTITTGDGANIVFGGYAGDRITTGSGDDIIVGDGGYADFDANGAILIVSDVGQTQGGNDQINSGTGRNTVIGGLGDDNIVAGVDSRIADIRTAHSNDMDVVLGDNGYRTFQGVTTDSDVKQKTTLSFNFQGQAANPIGSGKFAGATEYRSTNWNNLAGPLTGIGPSTFGNDPKEIMLNSEGERMAGLEFSYGGKENHRTNSIELNAYQQDFDPTKIPNPSGVVGGANDADGWLFAGGVRTSAPNDQLGNKLEVEMDGLNEYFDSYSVVVYIDAPNNVSNQTNIGTGESIRSVSNGTDTFYVDDSADTSNNAVHNFRGQYIKAGNDVKNLANPSAAKGKWANYVVFDNMTTDRFVITIKDGVPNVNYNGLDLPSIAGLQVIGHFRRQNVAASSGTELGGNDTISTSGGNDVVIGGAGNDTIATFGDIRQGAVDSDTVIGDDGKVVLMDHPGRAEADVFQAWSTAYAVGLDTSGASFDDVIVTGNGNDTVIGGVGSDRINTQRQDDIASGAFGTGVSVPEAMNANTFKALQDWTFQNLNVLSINMSYTGRDASINDADLLVTQVAGAVAVSNWNNLIVRDDLSQPQTISQNLTTSNGTTVSGISVNVQTRNTTTGQVSFAMGDHSYGQGQIDADSENARMFKGYLWAQKQDQIEVNITGLTQFAGSGTYDVYVYIDGDNERTAADEYSYEVSGNGNKYYLNDWRGNTFNGEFKRVTSTAPLSPNVGVSPDGRMVGNYVVFKNVTGTSFKIAVKNYLNGTQQPLNMANIAAIQIVTGSAKDSLPLNGDYDKDVVIGDDGKVKFDLDVPYGVYDDFAGAKNKVVEATTTTAKVAGKTNSDWIVTGRDQDLVMGGDGSDRIDAGVGDDTVIGDNALVKMTDYNPIGERSPLNLALLDNQVQDNSTYIGGMNWNAGSFHPESLPGVTLIASSAGAADLIDAGQDNDLVYGQEGNDAILDNEGTQDVVYDNQGSNIVKSPAAAYANVSAYLNDLQSILTTLDQAGKVAAMEFANNDFGPTQSLGVLASGSGIKLPTNQDISLALAAGQEVTLVASDWPGKGGTTQNVALSLSSVLAAMPGITVTVDNTALAPIAVAAGQSSVLLSQIPDAGPYSIRVKAAAAGTFKAKLTSV